MFSRSHSMSFRVASFAAVVAVLAMPMAVPHAALADTLSDLFGTPYDRIEVLEAGDSSFSSDEASSSDDEVSENDEANMDDGASAYDGAEGDDSFASSEDDIMLLSTSNNSISPRSMSGEMLYFCKWESGQNYNQGLSWGDGYHAMGYFQFDNRYDLGSFLYAVYSYNSSKYSALKVIGDTYKWNVSGTTYSNGAFTSLGNDLNNAWHACYNADPTEFSNLQNDWAYTQYYCASDGISGSLKAMGIDVDSRSDSVKSLVWGMANLFGKGGGKSYVEQGYYYGANWFIKNSGANGSMDDETFVTVLCDYIVNNVASRYPNQSQYWNGWRNRYRDEKSHYLEVIQKDDTAKRKALDELADANRDVLSDGNYVVRALCSFSGVLAVSGDSISDGANVLLSAANSTDAQTWAVSHDSAGYVTLINLKSGKALDVSGAVASQGRNVLQWTSTGGWNQKWIAVPLASGGVRLISGMGSSLSLDACGGRGNIGDNIEIWTSIDSGAQAFSFEATVTEREWLDDLASKNADTLKAGTYVVRALCSERGVLDVYGGSKQDGANVQLWSPNCADNQRWKVTVDKLGYVTLANVASGKALDAFGGTGTQGDNVIQWTPTGGWNQKWIAVAEGDGVRLYSAVHRGICLDSCGGFGRKGDNIELWGANGSKAQLFAFVNAYPSVSPCEEDVVDEGWYFLEPASSSGTSVDIYGGSRQKNANVQVWASNNMPNQAFRFSYSNGYFTVINSGSGLALDVAGSDVVTGANVTQWPNDSSYKNRQFSVMKNSDGTVTLINRATGLALDAGSGVSGSNVSACTPNGSNSQRFRLVAITSPIATGIYALGVDSDLTSVVDLTSSSAADGAGYVVWKYLGGLNQRWYIQEVSGKQGFYTIESLSSSKRLCANSDGTVSQRPAESGDNSQIWLAEFHDGYLSFASAAYPKKRLDVSGGGSISGTKIGMREESFSGSQHFVLIQASGDLPNGTYHVRAAADYKQLLDVSDASQADGASILSWVDNDGGNQKWNVSRNSDGTYTFTNCESGKVLDLAGSSIADGSKVIQYTSTGGANQRWKVQYVSGGWKITSALSPSVVLTIPGGAKNGSNICVSKDSSSLTQQRFTFAMTAYIPSNQKTMAWKAQNYFSGTNWLILADTTNNKVAVFSGSRGNWTIRKFWDCTSGAYNTPTVTGEFTVGSRGYSFGEEHGYSCYYWTQFYGAYLFHSVKYYANTRNIMDGRLGVNASAGCLRLQIDNAKWIYDTIPRGTKVVVYR